MTQGMLIRSNLNYISNNYERYGDLLDQINSQKKITRPSQDPVVAIKGMEYRSQVVEVEQFQRNLNEAYSWMDNADATLGETTQVLQRLKELTIQASNETYTPDQRNGIAKEVRELNNHLESLANTRVNNKYIFNGTDVNTKPVNIEGIGKGISDITLDSAPDMVVQYKGKEYTYDGAIPINESETTEGGVTTSITGMTHIFYNGQEELFITTKEVSTTIDEETITNTEESITFINASDNDSIELELATEDIIISNKNSYSTNKYEFEIEVMKGIKMDVNIDPKNVFSAELFKDVADLVKVLEQPGQTASDINAFISKIDKHYDGVTAERADLGARYNRVELIEDRLGRQDIIAKETMSKNEDIDIEKAITDLKIQELVHQAALAVGARIIQPTLMDFLR